MARTFTITAAGESITSSGSMAFTISNSSGRGLRARAKIVADGPAKDWLSLEGESEREIRADETQQWVVKSTVPGNAPEGRHPFRLIVFAVENPDELVNESPSVAVVVPKLEPTPGGSRWWIWAVAGAAVLVVGLVVYFLVSRKSGGDAVKVPNVVGKPFEEAKKSLEALKLTAVESDQKITGAKIGTVLSQDPAADAAVKPESNVMLVVESESVVVPNLSKKHWDEALKLLAAAGLFPGDITSKQTGGLPGGTILSQEPAAGKRAARGTTVALVVEKDMVTVPNVTGKKLSQATQELQSAGLQLGQIGKAVQKKPEGTVLSQDPKPGVKVGREQKVNLVVEAGYKINPEVEWMKGLPSKTVERIMRQPQ